MDTTLAPIGDPAARIDWHTSTGRPPKVQLLSPVDPCCFSCPLSDCIPESPRCPQRIIRLAALRAERALARAAQRCQS